MQLSIDKNMKQKKKHLILSLQSKFPETIIHNVQFNWKIIAIFSTEF